jgi:hypothetical protein
MGPFAWQETLVKCVTILLKMIFYYFELLLDEILIYYEVYSVEHVI